MSLKKNVYSDGNYEKSYSDTYENTKAIRGVETIDSFGFSYKSSNSISAVLSDANVDATKFSMTVQDALGQHKLNIFSDGYGEFIIINSNFLTSKGDPVFYTPSPNMNYEPLTDSTSAVYGVGNFHFNHLYEDLLDSSKGFTAAITSDGSYSQTTSDINYIVFPFLENISALKLNLSLQHVNESGATIIDCDNPDDPNLGNVQTHTKLIDSGDLKGATNITFSEVNLSNGVVNKYIAGDQGQWYNGYIKDTSPDASRPKFKHLVIPVKQSKLPTNNEIVHLGLIVFDKDLDAFQFRFINDLPEDDGTVYGVHHNGYGQETYGNVKAYHNMSAAPSSDQIYICTFSGFSFSDDTFQGLKKAASKKWNSSSKTFSIAGQYEYDYSTFEGIYEQLPVAFGNRLFPKTNNHLLNNIYSDFQDADYWAYNSTVENNRNVGFFNVAYATMYGFILMRLDSYAPVLLSPTSADGIEVHVPGGKWDYQEEDGSYPFQDAGGFTPISMEFSPDNNYLYTVVANPLDRTIRYLCVYDLTTLDADAINSSVVVYKDFEDATLKNVRLLGNGKIIVSSDGAAYRKTSINSDSFVGMSNLTVAHTSNYNFNVSHGSELLSTATADNTWKGSDIPAVSTGSVDLISTAQLDNLVLTPKGFIDTNTPENGFIENDFFNRDNNETWINSLSISDAAGQVLVSAKVERIDDITSVSIFNPNTGNIYETIILQDEFIHPGFYENPNSLSYVRLYTPLNTFAIVVNYANHNPLNQVFLNWAGTTQNLNDDSGWIGYVYSVVAFVDLNNSEPIITSAEDTVPGNYHDSLLYSPVVAQTHIGLGDQSGTSRLPQTYGHSTFISLNGSDTYLVQIINNDRDIYHNLGDGADGTLHFRTVIQNLSAITENDELKVCKYNSEDNLYTPANISSEQSDNIILDVNTFGSVEGQHSPPTHSYTCLAHDVSKTMVIVYSAAALQLFTLNNKIDENDITTNPNLTLYKNSHIISRTGIEASEKIKGYLNSDIELGYIISGAEFSANKQNVYLLLTKSYGTEHLVSGSDFKIVKINTGTSENLVGSVPDFEIPSDFVELVAEYYYNEAVGQSSDYSNVALPLGVDKATVADSNIQSNTVVTGMFKALNHSIYLTSETIGDGIPSTLGKIINADQISGENSYNTKYIKAGILL